MDTRLFGKRIGARRQMMRLTQADLAARLGVEALYGMYETGGGADAAAETEQLLAGE